MPTTPLIPLVILLRAPRLGQVKSRLAADLGEAAALECYRHLLDRVSTRLAGVDPVELRVTPDDAVAEMAPWMQTGWKAVPQGNGDLGERMLRAISTHTERGSGGCLVIGSDCPDVGDDDIAAARDALGQVDLVLGPASDGGYWLIGMRSPEPGLFRGVNWGTNTVLQQTLDRAREAGLRVALLRTLDDIDTSADWQRYRAVRESRESS